MKQFLRYTLTLVAILIATTNAWAQSPNFQYNTWYSLYDTEQQNNITVGTTFCEKAVFAPAESMTFEYKKYSRLSLNGKLQVQNNVNGNSWSGSKGEVSYSSTSWSTSQTISLDANISQIRYRMSSGTGASVRNHFVKLKQHILLNNSTTFGTNSLNVTDNNLATSVGVPSTNAYAIPLRSFFTQSGKITITSSNPEFHFSDGSKSKTFTLPTNNFCASTSADGSHGNNWQNISNFQEKIHFTPSVNINGTRSTTIIISDGTLEAQIVLTAPVKPTYFFKATAIPCVMDEDGTVTPSSVGGTATATFNNNGGGSTCEVITNNGVTSANAIATFAATPNTADGYVFDGWAENIDSDPFNTNQTITKEITSSALSEPESQQTYYAIFVKKYNPIIEGTQSYNMLVDEPLTTDFKWDKVDAPSDNYYPSSDENASFYFKIKHTLPVNAITTGSAHPDKVIAYDPKTNTITALNAGTAELTIEQKSNNKYNPKTFTCTITVNKHQTEFYLDLNSEYLVDEIDNNLFSTTTDLTGRTINVSDSKNYFTYSNGELIANCPTQLPADNDQTTITVTQPENYKWTSSTQEKTVIVKKYTTEFSWLLQPTYLVGEEITSIFNKSANGLSSTITSSDPTIVEVVDNSKLVAHRAGKVTIAIEQTVDRKWTAFRETKEITINKRNSNFQLLLGNTYYVDDQIVDAQIYSKDNNNSAPIHITSSDTNILEYDATNHKLIAKKKGTATIRVWQEKDTTWTEFDQSIMVNVIKHTPEFKWQGKVCSHGANCANTTTEYFNELYTDYFTTNNTATPISIVQQTDTNVANMYFVDGDTHTLDLTVYYKEAASTQAPYYTDITIVQDSNRYWEYHSETHRITPKNEDNHVEFLMNTKSLRDALFYAKENNHGEITCSEGGEISLNQNSVILWTANPLYYTIRFEGIPDELSFEYKMTSTATAIGDTRKAFIVYQSEDGNSWEEIWTTNGMPSNTSYEKVENEQLHKPLSKKTRFLKFFYDGTYTGYYRNIHVTEFNQFEATPTELDFETLYITDTPSKTMTFDLNYANAGHKVVLELDRTGTLANEEEYQRAQKYITIQPAFIDTIGGEYVGSVEDIQVILSSPDQTGYDIPEDARIKISDEAGNTTYVALKGNIAKSTQTITWNAYFSLPAPIQIPISTDTIRNAATATCKLPVKYRSDNEEVIKINEDSLSFYPVGIGTATITAYQTGNEQYSYVEDTKQVQVTEKSIQLIDWRDNLSDLILREDAPAIPLTAQVYIIDVVNNTFEHSPGQTEKLIYNVAKGGESIISVEGTTLTPVGLGETTLTVTIAADDSHEGATMTIPVIVREPAIGCEDELLLDQTAPTEIFTEGMNTNQVIKPAIPIDCSKGVPGYLKFEHKGEYWKLTGLINYYAGTIKAQQSTDGGNTWTDVPGSEIKPTVGTYNPTSLLPIDRNATHIRFVRPEGGQGYHYYRNVQVYPAQYLETNTTEISYGDINMGGKYDTKKFTISYSNIKSPLMATTSSKDVTVSPSYFGDCGDFGTQEIQITWQPSTQQNQYIIFQDTLADLSIRVDLTANIQLYKQKIVWENRPKAILDHTGIDNRPLYTRDANSNEELIDLPITYEVINSDSAYFENGMFFILNTDTINIKASSPGNNKYLAVDSIYQIIIQGIPPTFVGNTAEGADSLWTTSTNWVNEVMPTDDRPANIVAPVQINTEINVQGVRVAESGSIHITSTGGLTVGEGGIQTVTTDGSAIVIDNLHSGAGFFRISPDCEDELPRITMRYQTKSTLDSGANKNATWQYIGAPGEDASVHVDYNTWLYRLDESQADWVLMPQHNNHTLSPFQGYALTQYGQPTYEWNAQMINRNCTIPLTYHFDGRKGQNLIANSYTAPIDVTQMLPEDFQMIEGQSEYYDITQTLYLYNSGSWNAWHTQDSLSSDGNNTTPGQYYAIPVLAVAEGYIPERPTIAPMQGIYVRVRAKKTGGDTHVGNIIFDYDRIVMGEGHDMHRPMRAPKKSDITSIPSENFRRLRIVATSEHSGADRLYIIQDDINTRNYDNGYDAPNQATQGIVNIYTYESGGKMEVSCANNIDSTYIGFMAGEDRTYTLHFNAIIGETLYLQDLVSGEKIYIVEDGTYTFEAEPQSTNNKRFLLHAKRAINSDMEDVNAAHIWFSNHTLYVTNATDNSLLQLYDVSGHMIFSSTIHRTPYTVDLTHLTEGVYMARVNNQVYKFVCK